MCVKTENLREAHFFATENKTLLVTVCVENVCFYLSAAAFSV